MRSSRSCGATGPGSAPCDQSWVMPCAHDQQVAARRSASIPEFHPAVCASMMHARNEAYAAPAASMSAASAKSIRSLRHINSNTSVVRDAVGHVRAPVPGETRERFRTGGARASFERARQARETDGRDRGAQVAISAGEVARRRVVRDPGPPRDFAQAECGEAVAVEDVDRAVDQPLPGVDPVRHCHVDSVHVSVDAVNHQFRCGAPDRAQTSGRLPGARARTSRTRGAKVSRGSVS